VNYAAEGLRKQATYPGGAALEANNTCASGLKLRKLPPTSPIGSARRPAMPQNRRSAFAALIFALVAGTAFAPRSGMAAPVKAAFFPFEYVDLGEGPYAKPPPPEATRLTLITGLLRDRLAAANDYGSVDLAASAAAIDKSPPLRDCLRCAEEIARGAGAEIAVVGYVQKVSNLILNINITVSDVQTGRVLAAGSADIRGNTDESWTRGVEWLVKNRLAKTQP
jgi:Protein of unknown function (DUF2380)